MAINGLISVTGIIINYDIIWTPLTTRFWLKKTHIGCQRDLNPSCCDVWGVLGLSSVSPHDAERRYPTHASTLNNILYPRCGKRWPIGEARRRAMGGGDRDMWSNLLWVTYFFHKIPVKKLQDCTLNCILNLWVVSWMNM